MYVSIRLNVGLMNTHTERYQTHAYIYERYSTSCCCCCCSRGGRLSKLSLPVKLACGGNGSASAYRRADARSDRQHSSQCTRETQLGRLAVYWFANLLSSCRGRRWNRILTSVTFVYRPSGLDGDVLHLSGRWDNSVDVEGSVQRVR